MSRSIIDNYLAKRVKNITSYANLILKRTYDKTNNDLKLIESCIHKYINEFEFMKRDFDPLELENHDFFEKYNIREKLHKKMLVVLLDIITERDKPIDDEKLMDNLFMISRVIAIAYEIEYKTVMSLEENQNLKELISSIRERYGPYETEKINDNFNATNIKLKKLIQENIRSDNKYREIIDNSHFFIENYHLKLDEGPPGIVYETKLVNAYIELEKFNDDKVKELSSNKNILYEYVFINLELAVLKLIEMLLSNRNIEMFVIGVPEGFLSKKTNISRLIEITKNNLVRQKICFRIDRDELEKYHDAILKIKNSDFRITIANIDEEGVLTEKLKSIADSVMVTSNTKEDLKKYITECNLRLLEKDIGLKDVILEL